MDSAAGPRCVRVVALLASPDPSGVAPPLDLPRNGARLIRTTWADLRAALLVLAAALVSALQTPILPAAALPLLHSSSSFPARDVARLVSREHAEQACIETHRGSRQWIGGRTQECTLR